MTSFNFAASARPLPSALSRCTMHENASTGSAFTSMSSFTMSVSDVIGVLVIHRAETARDAFDAVMEINQDFVQRHRLVSITRRESSVSV